MGYKLGIPDDLAAPLLRRHGSKLYVVAQREWKALRSVLKKHTRAYAACKALDIELTPVLIHSMGDLAESDQVELVRRPLSAKAFQKHIGVDGRIRLAIAVTLSEIWNCGSIDDFNELVDARICEAGSRWCLSDIAYQPLWVENGRVVVEVDAYVDKIELRWGRQG